MGRKSKKTPEELELEEAKWMDIVSDLVEKYQIGELIPHEHLRKVFESTEEELTLDEELTSEFINFSEIRDILKSIDLKYMSFIDKVWNTSLKKFRLLIKNVYGQGYIFVNAKEQTDHAVRQLDKDLKKAFSECILILENIRIEELDAAKRKENTDALAHVSMKRQLLKSGYKN